MSNVANFKSGVRAWGKEREIVRVKYDFAVDAGAQGALGLFSVSGQHIVESAKAICKTVVTSLGSPTIEVGVAGDTAGLIAQFAKTAVDAVGETAFGVAQDQSHVLADGATVIMTIASADLTAGVIDFLFELQKV